MGGAEVTNLLLNPSGRRDCHHETDHHLTGGQQDTITLSHSSSRRSCLSLSPTTDDTSSPPSGEVPKVIFHLGWVSSQSMVTINLRDSFRQQGRRP